MSLRRRLRIFSIDCSTALSQDDSSPQIVQTGDIRLPPGSFARSVVLRDSVACLHGGSELFLSMSISSRASVYHLAQSEQTAHLVPLRPTWFVYSLVSHNML